MSAKVIVIDPSRAFAQMVQSMCHRHGAVADIFTGQSAAMAAAASQNGIEAITVSSYLEDGDGISLIYGLRTLGHLARTPILFLTSDDNPETARTALVAGATEVFQKSDTDALEKALTVAVSERNLPSTFGGRALIVEDTVSIADLLKNLCEELGLECDTATSAEEGFNFFRAGCYQLAVIDVILAGLHSGIDLVRQIRRLPDSRSRIPILVTSSYNDTARRIELLRCGADDFMSKPLIEEEVVWRIRNLLQRIRWEPETPVEGKATMDEIQELLRQHYRLSPREAEISTAVLGGLSDKEIAARFGISFWTVRTHINHIFTKTGTYNRANFAAQVNKFREDSRSLSLRSA